MLSIQSLKLARKFTFQQDTNLQLRPKKWMWRTLTGTTSNISAGIWMYLYPAWEVPREKQQKITKEKPTKAAGCNCCPSCSSTLGRVSTYEKVRVSEKCWNSWIHPALWWVKITWLDCSSITVRVLSQIQKVNTSGLQFFSQPSEGLMVSSGMWLSWEQPSGRTH